MTGADQLAALERRPLPGGELTLLVAGNRGARRRGLARLDPDALPQGHGLLFERCRSVHTIGMRFALDLVWLDGEGRLVRLDSGVAPRRLRTCLRARSVVETAAGEGERFAAALAGRGG
jgi:uncharacterized membrane protein (UPF0127 family)